MRSLAFISMSVPERSEATHRDGKYGLWIDSDLAKGVSARCPAFDNDTLCTVGKEKGGEDGEEASCEVLALEIWRIAEP